VSARTRSWGQAERLAQAEWDKRDPVQLELKKIADQGAKDAAQLRPLGEALEQWLTGMKGPGAASINAYRSTARKIQRWADRTSVVCADEVTPTMLDQWRDSWAPNADDRENRLSLTTQAALLIRIKAFFRWATAIEYTKRNPTLMLKAITPDDSQTWPSLPCNLMCC